MANSAYSRRSLVEVDWNFPNLHNEGVNAVHWYPATFLAAIPGTVIPLLSAAGDLVIDPFCGTSTTGVEAVRLGRRFLGVDTNPVATLISKAKLLLPDTKTLQAVLGGQRLARLYIETRRTRAQSHPREAELLRWYHPSTYAELYFILARLRKVDDPALLIAARAVFSSILKASSSQARHWGWVCDNVTPKKDEIQYKNAFSLYERALEDYVAATLRLREDIARRQGPVNPVTLRSKWSVVCADAVDCLTEVADGAAGLIVTSPPYYGVADYVKSQRLSFLWFTGEPLAIDGYGGDDFEQLRQREVGSRSFRRRRASFEDYVTYMSRFFASAARVLQPGGFLALIIGHSDARVSTAAALEAAARGAGFRSFFGVDRDIKATRRRLMAKVRGEKILVLVRA